MQAQVKRQNTPSDWKTLVKHF